MLRRNLSRSGVSIAYPGVLGLDPPPQPELVYVTYGGLQVYYRVSVDPVTYGVTNGGS